MPADTPMVLVPRERLIRFAYEFVREQAEGEWGDNLIAKDAEKLIAGLTALSAPSSTSTAEQVGEALAPYLEDLKGIREEMAKPDAPTPGEGDAPVAWRSRIKHPAPGEYGGWVITTDRGYVEGFLTRLGHEIQPLFTRPTPATPEGLRPFGLSPLEIKRIRSALIDGLEKAYWAGSEVAQGFDAAKEADAVLAALQPQGGSDD